MSFERPISENHDFEPFKIELWLLQGIEPFCSSYWENLNHLHILNGHNFSSDGPIMLILCFSESLERSLSDGVIKVYI